MAAEGELLDSGSGSISETMFSSVNRWRCGTLLDWNGVCFFQGWFVALFRHGDWRLEIWERWREETTGAPRRAGRGRDARGSPRPRYPAKKHELLWFWGAAHAKNLPPGTSSRHPGKTPRARRATRCRLRDVADLGAKGPWFLGIYACVPRPPPPSDVMRRHSRCRICLLCLLCLFSCSLDLLICSS